MSVANAERRRLFKRRSVKIMLGLAVLILAGVATSFTLISHRHDAAATAMAERKAQAMYEEQIGYHRQFVEQCKAAKAAKTQEGEKFPEDCFEGSGPTRENFPPEQFLPFQFVFVDHFGIMISVFAAVLVLVAFVIGATFVGAEWNSGGMMNLLLWRPRRMPVLMTKLGVLLGGVLAVGAVLGAAWTTAFYLIGKHDGALGKLTSGVWRSFAISGARALALVLAFAVFGFALASIGRHTAMALGVAIGIALASEVGLRIVFGIIRQPFGERWMLSTYAASWMEKSVILRDYSTCDFSLGECRPKEMVFTWQQSAWVFGAAIVVLVGVALWSIRRRDVT